ncbi:predicted protein [Streptomyces iranensis]|uniref:Uncharacterized protein n=1 Tax=Streptomyces iranensis TaxID=576784 RepID=A0A060ZPT8_9ACTN|nr:predicted protein [Streptomyces iranensis]
MRAATQDRETDQRWPRRIEPYGAVLGQPPLHRVPAFVLRDRGEVRLLPRHGHRTGDGLDGMGQAVMQKRGAQMRMPAQQRVGGHAEPARVEGALQLQAELDEIHIRGRVVVHGVEQQSLLQRAERQNLHTARGLPLDALRLRPGEPDECSF